jgi:uncharacterized protein YdiU (UPF0061 family)
LLQDSFYAALNEAQQQQLADVMNPYIERLLQNSITREKTQQAQRQTSPRFILRNYLLHQAIEALSNGDNTLFNELKEAMKTPYSRAHDRFFQKRPDWAGQKAGCSMLSCSS